LTQRLGPRKAICRGPVPKIIFIASILQRIPRRNTMDRAQALETLKDIIVEQLSVNKADIQENSKFVDDLGADSLDTVELIMAIEEKFGLEIPDQEAEKITTVGEALNHIEKAQA